MARTTAPEMDELDAAGEQRSVLDSLRPILMDATGWSVSLVLHGALFLGLGMFHLATQQDADTTIISSLEQDQIEPDFDVAITDQIGSGAEVTSLTAGAPQAQQVAATPEQPIEPIRDETDKGPQLQDDSQEIEIPKDVMVASINTTGNGTENVQGGTEGAIDRLTLELAQSLRQKKTLVIWLFDGSQSMVKRRDMIANRFENVYKQLDSLEVNKDKALKTAVMYFQEKNTFLTDKPVDDIRPLLPKIRSIPANKDTPKEFVFAAVQAAIKQYTKYREGRNVMLIVVTDERGDDAGASGEYLDQTIMLARRNAFKCYTVGNASLFGREESYVMWEYEDKTTEELPVDGGPETVRPEALAVGFWGDRGPDLSRMSSGYGPYALTRLCKETGGLYFIVEEGAGQKFNSAIMRNYQPEYKPIKDYDMALAKNKAKAALVMAATKSKVDKINLPPLVFAAYTDNKLREELTEVQRPAAVLDFKMNELYQILAQGEKDRDKITEPRWRAAYDLAMGRVLAMRARIFGFNRMAAEMKGLPKPFTNKANNEWRLVPSKKSDATPDVKKMEKQALTYLKRVIDEHPDTPWALQAQRELETPLGWEWKESKGDYDVPNPNETPEQKRVRLAKDEEKKKQMMKNAAAAQRPKPNL